MDYRRLADEVLKGSSITREQALEILSSDDDHLLDLLSSAFLLRRARFGRGVMLHVIRNAKSGSCTENCAYCSQSAISKAAIPCYPMQSVEELVAGAREAHRADAVRYCLVTSGREASTEETDRVCEAARHQSRAAAVHLRFARGAR